MRKFSILRYLKQFSLLIFLLSALGALAIAFYGKAQQRYVASAVIRYTNSAAKQGYTPDGSPLNVEEIYSPAVIDAALTDLGDRSGIDSVRSGCYVEEVIPETQLKRNEALLEKGEDPAYTADTYRVYFVGDSDAGEDHARIMLDAILKNYCEFYAEKYVEEQLQNNGVSVLGEGNYDYLDSAEVLDRSVSEMLYYLLDKRASHPNFRSVETGYTWPADEGLRGPAAVYREPAGTGRFAEKADRQLQRAQPGDDGLPLSEHGRSEQRHGIHPQGRGRGPGAQEQGDDLRRAHP